MDISSLKQLLGEDKLGELFQALLQHPGIRQDKELHHTLLVQQNRFHQYEKHLRNGTLNTEELNLLRNRVLSALLSVMEELEDGKTTGKAPSGKWRKWGLLLGAGLILLMVFWGGWAAFSGNKNSETGQPSASSQQGISPGKVEFPEGNKVVFISSTGTETSYQVLQGTVTDAGGGVKKLSLRVRCSTAKGYGVNFWDASFRLEQDEAGVLLAPVSGLNEVVENNSSKEGELLFVLERPSMQMKLVVINPFDREDQRRLTLSL